MNWSRRELIKTVGSASMAGLVAPAALGTRQILPPAPAGKISLPDRSNFLFDGIHLNAAYTHPIGVQTSEASKRYMEARMVDPSRIGPGQNPRNAAVELYARLVNAAPTEIAVVPSTLEGENLIAAALGLGPGKGVVSDSLHYDAALVLHGEMAKKGMPLTVLSPKDFQIDYQELDRAITPQTGLVAISHVSSATGYKHDLKKVCDIAHAKGALVYADVIQSVGAIPFDVKESGIDFCCAGMYKWLQGDFGAAFLYVRGDRLKDLKRVQIGWRGVKSYQEHFLPGEPPGPAVGEWALGTDTASIFEVSTPNWSGLAIATGSLKYIQDIGIEAIAQHREPMLQRLQEEMPRAGWQPLTPKAFQGPALVFAREGARDRFGPALKAAKIVTTVYPNRIRISPSVHNSMGDIDKLLAILTAKA